MRGKISDFNSYCFITSTFTLSNLTLPASSPHPGVGPMHHREVFPPGMKKEATLEDEGEVKFHAYYQWVPFMLVIQGLLLYIPSALWQTKENGYLESLLSGMHRVHIDKMECKKKRKQSVSSFTQSLGSNDKFMLWFFVSEVLACAFALSNLFLTDAFLGGKFFDFGKGALTYLTGSVTERNNPLNIAFPKGGKCTWYKFGPSGSIVSRDALCVLPRNIVNEKTYVILWLVYILTCAFTFTILLYHCYLLLLPGRMGALISRHSEV
ncbi:Innexin [Trinorchestia longiramus]|nr:Innexin [Trinorchestia longiramus]